MKFSHNLYKYNDGKIEVAAVLVGNNEVEYTAIDYEPTEFGTPPASISSHGLDGEWFASPRLAIENEVEKAKKTIADDKVTLGQFQSLLKVMDMVEA